MSVEYRKHSWNIQAPWKPHRGIGNEMLAMLGCRFGDGESSCQRDSEPLGEVLVTAQCMYFIQFSFQTDVQNLASFNTTKLSFFVAACNANECMLKVSSSSWSSPVAISQPEQHIDFRFHIQHWSLKIFLSLSCMLINYLKGQIAVRGKWDIWCQTQLAFSYIILNKRHLHPGRLSWMKGKSAPKAKLFLERSPCLGVITANTTASFRLFKMRKRENKIWMPVILQFMHDEWKKWRLEPSGVLAALCSEQMSCLFYHVLLE